MWNNIKNWNWLTVHSDFMNNVNFLAGMGHFAWACWTTLAMFILFSSHTACYVTIGWVIAAGLKEYVYDANFERPKQTFWDNTSDFLEYCGGLGVAWIIIYVKGII